MLTAFYSEQYHQGIDSDIIIKPQWVADALQKNKLAQIHEPAFISEKDILAVHDSEYIQALKTGQPQKLAESSGLKWTPELYEASLSSVSGMYHAALQALEDGVAASLSTNFHHAQKEHGADFCVLNGIAITALKLLQEKKAAYITILDCDYHYGDGTADLLGNHKDVFVFDLYDDYLNTDRPRYQAENLHFFEIADQEDYFEALDVFSSAVEGTKSDLIIYLAGVDWHEDDRIGGLAGFGQDQLRKRDRLVFEMAKQYQIPIVFMPGGGYAKYTDQDGNQLDADQIQKHQDQIVQMHLNTFRETA